MSKPRDRADEIPVGTVLGDRFEIAGTLGLVALPVGLVAVGVGIAVLATAPDAPSEPTVEWARSLRPSVRVGAGGAHVAVGGLLPSW